MFKIIKGCTADNTMTSSELCACMKEVWYFVDQNNLWRTKARLKPLDKETRRKVLALKYRDKSPFFLACKKGYLHFVNYFLDECGIDIEERSVYEVAEDRSKHLVTPLWCSAVANHLDVVKSLINHDADVNGMSDTLSTPVRSACYMTNIEVVKYLVDHDADIHKPNINGGTCLINSVQSVELCNLLIKHGADVNAQDNSGNLALHYAIREGRLETVQLLVEFNSDVFLKNEIGDDSLQTAALRGFEDIVEYLVSKTEPTKESVIQAYELMGANYVDEKHDIPKGLAFWRESLHLQERYRDSVTNKSTTVAMVEANPAYENMKEFITEKELDIVARNPDAVYMQGLLIRERILGPTHKDTTFGLMYRGAVYADTHRYQRCIDIWTYALLIRHKHFKPITQETVFIHLLAITRLFWEIWFEENVPTNSPASLSIRFPDVYKVLTITGDQIENGIQILPDETDPNFKQYTEYFHTVLLLFLHIINLLSSLVLNDEEDFIFRKFVHKIVSLNPLGPRQANLLHLALCSESSTVDHEKCSNLPNLQVVILLVECGAPINANDVNGNTPLHILAETMHRMSNRLQYDFNNLASYLLEHGAHVDASNHKYQVAYQELVKHGCSVSAFEYLSLKCLAAAAIRRYGLAYTDSDLPRNLKPFIDIH